MLFWAPEGVPLASAPLPGQPFCLPNQSSVSAVLFLGASAGRVVPAQRKIELTTFILLFAMIIPLTSDIRRIDSETCKAQRISSYQLMERAASLAAAEIMRRWPDRHTRCLVLAGTGNNGGDALVVLRLLYEAGYPVLGCQYGASAKLSADCAEARARLPERLLFDVDLHSALPELHAGDLIIDGLFGSGLNRPLEGGNAFLVRYMNDSEATVISIDIPSGLMGESNEGNDYGAIVHAALTLTFSVPKLSFFFEENASCIGECHTIDIGLDAAAMAASATPYRLITAADVSPLLRIRDRFSHKGSYGRAWLAAGSRGMMGAALLAARACMRSGVGLLTVSAPACGYDILQLGIPEAKCECDPMDGHLSRLAYSDEYTALGIGPGIGKHPDTVKAFRAWLADAARPMVLDADALNILADHPEWLSLLKRHAILTPHPREADRLLAAAARGGFLSEEEMLSSAYDSAGVSSYERMRRVRHLARQLGVVIVLKGACTMVCCPDGETWINALCGHPGMAVGGSGDVLTGVILALLAQRYPVEKAALIGAFLHASAADRALSGQSYESWLPSDLIAHLGETFAGLRG